jgi:hypothetical protein
MTGVGSPLLRCRVSADLDGWCRAQLAGQS